MAETLYFMPLREDLYNYEYPIELDGTTFIIGLRYNQRMDSWFMSLSKNDGTSLVTGIALKLTVNLLDIYSYIEGMPTGELWVGNSQDFEEPNLENFGVKTFLFYKGDS